jgi:hypothetical protein
VTRWFLDTEFNEDGRTIELISIALVSEGGREYYAHSADYDPAACNDWVKANVLPYLENEPRVPRKRIAEDIRALVLSDADATVELASGARMLVGERSSVVPEFWAYYADYDWVALCQLYGPMIALPDGFPMYCRDLKQLMDESGVTKETPLPAQENEHSALDDARWVRKTWLHLKGFLV